MLATAVSRRTALSLSTLRSASTWSAVVAGPPDPILGAYQAGDPSAHPDSLHSPQTFSLRI